MWLVVPIFSVIVIVDLVCVAFSATARRSSATSAGTSGWRSRAGLWLLFVALLWAANRVVVLSSTLIAIFAEGVAVLRSEDVAFRAEFTFILWRAWCSSASSADSIRSAAACSFGSSRLSTASSSIVCSDGVELLVLIDGDSSRFDGVASFKHFGYVFQAFIVF
jgi:hypothetical protein